MAKLPSLSYRQFVKKLKKAGFVLKRQAAGSHEIWFHPEKKRTVTVARHGGKTFKKGILSAMVDDTGLTREEFLNL